MRTDRSDAIRKCMAEAQGWLESAEEHHAEPVAAGLAAIANVYVQMAQVHVAMQEWSIEEEPA